MMPFFFFIASITRLDFFFSSPFSKSKNETSLDIVVSIFNVPLSNSISSNITPSLPNLDFKIAKVALPSSFCYNVFATDKIK